MPARRRTRVAENANLSVYHGRRMVGRIVERNRRCTAYTWPEGVNLGHFTTRKAAADAISAAAGPRPQGGRTA